LKNKSIILLVLVAFLIASILITSTIGASNISLSEVIQITINKLTFGTTSNLQNEAIIWNVRVPRVLASVFVGCILSITGTAIQGVFRNPLADPSIIGISAGAALSAAVAIVLFQQIIFSFTIGGLGLLSVITFIGSFITAIIVFKISQHQKKTDVATMLLAGIAINAFAGAIMGFIIYLSDDSQLRTITFWTMGSLGGILWKHVLLLAICAIVAVVTFIGLGKSLNALALGESEANLIGVNTEKIKRKIVIVTALVIGVTVAFCGMIGFIGLVVPHIIRLVVGADHRFLIPASALGGSLLLIWADTLSRTIVAPAELPIGIITALIGAPLFLYLLIKQKTKQL
jgi:iron complex transport system permease protein